MVRPRRLELPRYYYHRDLNPARLPIPPRSLIIFYNFVCLAVIGEGDKKFYPSPYPTKIFAMTMATMPNILTASPIFWGIK